jgi:hypothetical protein
VTLNNGFSLLEDAPNATKRNGACERLHVSRRTGSDLLQAHAKIQAHSCDMLKVKMEWCDNNNIALCGMLCDAMRQTAREVS